ncbi:hypothetical protein M8J75_000748 [Diaphorina citri]|nr:hypothetical protein M8J75_000748 [Diaphorina citri]
MTGFCSQDLTTIKILYHKGNALKEALVSSAYFPYDSPSHPPSHEVNQLVEFSELQNLELLIGVDANAHNKIWGSTDTNSRDEPSHSDHRYIRFEVSGVDKPDVTYRNPRKTKWRCYRQCLESELRLMRTDIKDTGDIEEVSNNLSIAINKAYGLLS